MKKFLPIVIATLMIFGGLYLVASPYLPKEPGIDREETVEGVERPEANPGVLGVALMAGGILVLFMAFRR
jgi:hypothetical protein